MAVKDTDLQKITELIEIMKENDLIEVEIKHGDDKIFVKRAQPQPPVLTTTPVIRPERSVPTDTVITDSPEAVSSPAVSPQTEQLVEIKSPIVGTFYATPSPDSEPYVEIGSHVDPQTVVGIIEAMKVMNEIKAETSGTIAEILVTNGQAVEYGQVLFKVRPD